MCTYTHIHTHTHTHTHKHKHTQSFHFVETAPLLCILDDFLKPLDDFLYKYEKRKKRTNTSKDDSQTMNQEGTDQDGTREGDERYKTDAFYLEGLELYCLLNCRLLNMKHLWRIVIDQALPNQWKGTTCYNSFLIDINV